MENKSVPFFGPLLRLSLSHSDRGAGNPYRSSRPSGFPERRLDRVHGKKTANGKIYDQNELTAAHRTFPLGRIKRGAAS